MRVISILRRIIRDFLYIKKDEQKKVLFFFILFTILMMGQEIGIGTSASLFLTNAGINKLPLMLLIAAVVNTAAVIIYVALSARRDNRSLFSLILKMGLFTLIPAQLAAGRYPVISSYVIYAISELMLSSIQLHFSVYLADYFDTRQAKRLFPVILAGSKLGGITGGLILTLVTRYVGSTNILLFWAATIVGSFFILKRINTIFIPEVFDYEKNKKESSKFFQHIKSGIKFLKGSSLLKAIASGVFMLGFLSVVIKFLYSGVFVKTFPKTDQLTSFFGIYIVASNVLGFLVQILISNRLIDSLGLGAANLAYAISFSSGFAGLALFPGLPSAIWARFTDEHLESAIQDPVESLLYNAIPDTERVRARALSSGMIKPISEITGSVCLQFMKNIFQPVSIAWFGLGASAIYIVIVTWQNRGYVQGLMRMVREKTLSLEDLENLRWEKASRRDLDKLYAMASGKDESVRDSAANLLLHLDEDIDFDILRKSFFDWSTDIQQEYLRNYFRRWNDIDEDFLKTALEHCDTPVKALVIEYFIEMASPTARSIIYGYLHQQENLELQNYAIRFFMITGFEGKEEAEKILEQRLHAVDEEIIHANLSIIRQLFDESRISYVEDLTYHSKRTIAIDAVNTLGIIYQPRGREEFEMLTLVEDLIHRGGYHEVRAAVRILGKKIGSTERDLLIHLLDTNSAPLKKLIIDTLVQNYPGDTNVYLRFLEAPNIPLTAKENILSIIQRLQKKPDPGRLKEILKSFIKEYFQLIREQGWLLKNELSSSLMGEINERKKSQIRIIILRFLEVLLHQKVVLSIEKALLSRNLRLISNAMELFENLWDKKQAGDLISLLYPESFEEELKLSRKFTREETLQLSSFVERYLKHELPRWDICAVIMLISDTHKIEKFQDEIQPFCDHSDTLVQEIARSVLTGKIQKRSKTEMLTTIEKIIYLKNAPIFKSLKMDELKMVADISREHNYVEGENIIEKGELGDTMFIIASGEVEIYLPGKERKRLVVLKESEFFGEMALFGEDVRSASADALKPTKLLCLERSHFFNLIYEKPDISIEIIKVLSDRLRNMDKVAAGD